MARATNYRDKPHARIYAAWRDLPVWEMMDAQSKALLVEMLTIYRPQNPIIEMSDRKAANLIPCSRSKAADALRMLEALGWIRVERVGAACQRGHKRRSSAYRLTCLMFHDLPATEDYLRYVREGSKRQLL